MKTAGLAEKNVTYQKSGNSENGRVGPINDGIEDTAHFLLLCNSFAEYRRSLLADANDVLQTYGYSEAPGDNILQLLLYGDESLPLEANALILNLTIKFILETERFD